MKTSILTLGLLICTLGVSAQDIKLPEPDMKAKSSTVIDALSKRHSTREFASTPLSNQELSNLCWAACGVSRDENHRTAPTAMNRQEVRLFVFTENGVYEYDAKANTLVEKARVNSISPGWIETFEDASTASGYAEYTGPDAIQQPVGRVGNPLDIANMVLFLCSDKAGFITGENICIDGGMTKQMIYHGEHGWTLDS